MTVLNAYARMSTDKQIDSPTIQVQQIRQWYEDALAFDRIPKDTQWGEPMVDAAVSSKQHFLDRPHGSALVCSENSGNIVVCSKFNRAFRSAADSERTLDAANKFGIRMIFLDLQIDSSTPNGIAMVGMLSVLSRHERDMRSQTTKEAHALRKLQVKPVGQRGIIGWKIQRDIPKGQPGSEAYFVPDPFQRKQCDWIADQIINHDMQTSELYPAMCKREPFLVGDLKMIKKWKAANATACSVLGYPKLYLNDIMSTLRKHGLTGVTWARARRFKEAREIIDARLQEVAHQRANIADMQTWGHSGGARID